MAFFGGLRLPSEAALPPPLGEATSRRFIPPERVALLRDRRQDGGSPYRRLAEDGSPHHATVTKADLRDGWLARNLFFVSKTRPKPRFVPEQEVPARIRAEVLTWKKEPAGVHTVCAEAGAREAFEAFNDEIYAKMLAADRTGDETNYLYGKALENARRVALTLAVGRDAVRLPPRAVPRGRPHPRREGDGLRVAGREGEEAHPPGGRGGGERGDHPQRADEEDAVHPEDIPRRISGRPRGERRAGDGH